MVDTATRSSRQQARRLQQRRTIVLVLAAAVVLGGAGTAWAMTRSSGPRYRLATVQRADITQTVAADGTIATVHQAAVAFATSGTVRSVRVHEGDTVHAGQVVARLDPTALAAAVVSAKQTLATAKQRLATDETTQASTAATTAAATGASRSTIELTAAVQKTNTDPNVAAVVRAQHTLVHAQHQLDVAVSAEDDAIDAATTACAETDDTTAVTVSATADGSGTVQGTIGGQAVTATLLDADGSTDHTTSSTNPQVVAAGGSYRFAGLTAGGTYEVSVMRSGKVIDTTTCTAALSAVQTRRSAVDTATGTVDSDITTLSTAVTALQHGTGTPTGTPSQPSSSGSSSSGASGPPTSQPSDRSSSRPTGRPTGATSSGVAQSSSQPIGRTSTSGGTDSNGSGGSTTGGTTTVTAQQLVADQKSIDAARAVLRLARQNRGLAALHAPIGGTVAALAVSSGDSVSTSTTVLQVVGGGRKSVTVDVSLAKIDLVKAGQTVHVTVDGHTEAMSGRVSQVGLTNTSSSTGSSSTYAVTVVLDPTAVHLYDGMGASVEIDVGSVRSAVSVPLSAVTTAGNLPAVRSYADGSITATRVVLGVQGDDRVQVTSGLRVGQQVVLAEVSAPIPSDTDTTTRRFGGGLTTGFGGGQPGP